MAMWMRHSLQFGGTGGGGGGGGGPFAGGGRSRGAWLLGSFAAAFVLLACGGSGSDVEGDVVADTYGDELPPAAEPVEEDRHVEPVSPPEPEPEPAATGPARLTVKMRIGSEEIDGQVRVLDDTGEVVHEGRAGRTFTVEAGTYALEGVVGDASVLADEPTRRGEAFVVEPGETRTEAVEFGRSRVRLKVLRGGRPVRNARVELKRQGGDEVIIDFRPGDEHVPISPGRYEAVVHFGQMRVDVSGLVFQGGATQDIPVRVQ